MAGRGGILLASLLILSCFADTSFGIVHFSSLKRTLVVTASPKTGQVLKAGDDKFTVTWGLNKTFPAGTDSAYKTIKLKLCYSPISQVERPWRKTEDELSRDKTCQFNIVTKPYSAANQSYEWIVEREVTLGTYFVRAYAYDSADAEVAFGQTTDAAKKTNLFDIIAISGRHTSLDIASICFSAFSILALIGFFWAEKRKGKSSK
ncbi:high-affinity nitrate transporter 3.1 [Humulus lupulus]|uniref:high-affinity nitrate transporter 3.1 n=1 Tax=Humulus lupulus TaxID=3486 RepID=UPI002B414F29|nr:high-affinity nitrate transporter 3.1 [Humulus lupulus]